MMARKRKYHWHYSGDRSVDFWNRINAVSDTEKDNLKLYRLGCELQNLEITVMRELSKAEYPSPGDSR